jgi:hypothetical protein
MYAMCHTKDNDVLKCVKKMRSQKVNYPIFQVGQDCYKKCDADRSLAMKKVAKGKNRRFAINMATETLHREGCKVLKRTKKSSLIGAYLVKPKDTGLKSCKHCMV